MSIPKDLPCPFCGNGKMIVFFDREIYRNQALCTSCQSKMDLQNYGSARKEYRDKLAKMQAKQKRINKYN